MGSRSVEALVETAHGRSDRFDLRSRERAIPFERHELRTTAVVPVDDLAPVVRLSWNKTHRPRHVGESFVD